MRSLLNEFKKFILRGNVVDLAVGLVIGAAFGAIVSSLVADIFMPVIGLITGGIDISQEKYIHGKAELKWGQFLQNVINFLIIGFCMFLVVKGMNTLHRYVLKNDESSLPVEPTPTEKLLSEIRDLLKQNAASGTTSAVIAPTAGTDAKPPA